VVRTNAPSPLCTRLCRALVWLWGMQSRWHCMSVPARACRARGMKVSREVRGLLRMFGCAIMGYVGRDFEPSLNQSTEATVFFVK
jgi:hypothetical protein